MFYKTLNFFWRFLDVSAIILSYNVLVDKISV